MKRVTVVSGDISKVKADALITAINSGGVWFGGIDGVIGRVAGNLFHSQAGNKMPLRDGQTVVAYGNINNRGAFANVVFVVDDLERPLHEIVYDGLKAASVAGFTTVTLPTVRMGVMLGVVEKSTEQAVQEMAKGVKRFLDDYSATSIKSITFVVYSDQKTQTLLENAFVVQ